MGGTVTLVVVRLVEPCEEPELDGLDPDEHPASASAITPTAPMESQRQWHPDV